MLAAYFGISALERTGTSGFLVLSLYYIERAIISKMQIAVKPLIILKNYLNVQHQFGN